MLKKNYIFEKGEFRIVGGVRDEGMGNDTAYVEGGSGTRCTPGRMQAMPASAVHVGRGDAVDTTPEDHQCTLDGLLVDFCGTAGGSARQCTLGGGMLVDRGCRAECT